MRPILKKRPDWRNAGVSQLKFLFKGKTFFIHSQLYFAVEDQYQHQHSFMSREKPEETALKLSVGTPL